MSNLDTISLSDLSAQIRKSADVALKGHALTRGATAELSLAPNHGIVGYVIQGGDLANIKLSDATDLAHKIAGAHGTPSVLALNKKILIGFVANEKIFKL